MKEDEGNNVLRNVHEGANMGKIERGVVIRKMMMIRVRATIRVRWGTGARIRTKKRTLQLPPSRALSLAVVGRRTLVSRVVDSGGRKSSGRFRGAGPLTVVSVEATPWEKGIGFEVADVDVYRDDRTTKYERLVPEPGTSHSAVRHSPYSGSPPYVGKRRDRPQRE